MNKKLGIVERRDKNDFDMKEYQHTSTAKNSQ